MEGELTDNVLVCPETINAFNACDAVIAYDDVPANWESTEDVYVLKSSISNLPVPTSSPLRNNEPVTLKLPVKFKLPLMLTEPVLIVFVAINSSTEGPREPETAM